MIVANKEEEAPPGSRGFVQLYELLESPSDCSNPPPNCTIPSCDMSSALTMGFEQSEGDLSSYDEIRALHKSPAPRGGLLLAYLLQS